MCGDTIIDALAEGFEPMMRYTASFAIESYRFKCLYPTSCKQFCAATNRAIRVPERILIVKGREIEMRSLCEGGDHGPLEYELIAKLVHER